MVMSPFYIIPISQAVMIKYWPISTCIAPVMGRSLPFDIVLSIAWTLGLWERPFLILSSFSCDPLPFALHRHIYSPIWWQHKCPPSALLWVFLFQMPSWCNHQILLACTMMGQQEKEQIHRRIIKITTSCKGKKEQGENIGEMMGGWGNRESLSKELTFELSPEGCEGARKTSGKAFQAAARETGNKGSQALDRTTCRLSGHWPWGVWDCF